ncbi:MAG TPA: ComF family protein [Syntrophobacteraceae bacterium]|nr:ComF family protein [Syntrophobacteraceae bacterium]
MYGRFAFHDVMTRCSSALGPIGSGLKFACSALLELLLPGSCAGCRRIRTPLERSWCPACWNQIPWIVSPLCPVCGRPFRDSGASSNYLCGECAKSAFYFDTARSATFHEGIVRDRVHQLKFGSQTEWAPPLVELLEMAYSGWGLPAPDLIVPVPLHLKRLAQRGFNQSGLLASRLGRKLKAPVSNNIIRRKHRTQPQTRLSREQRLKNVKGAFEVADVQMARGRRVLLVDDVFTTGTTLSECAKTLKRRGGASEVHAITVTRALPD